MDLTWLPLEVCHLVVVRPLGPFIVLWVLRGVDGRDGGCFGGLMTWALGCDVLSLGFDGVDGVQWCGWGWGCLDGVRCCVGAETMIGRAGW